MDIDLLRSELERLFDLDELFTLTRELIGFEPEDIGGTAGKGSFVRALTEHCAEQDAVEALCDAVFASKQDVSPQVAALSLRGLPPADEIPLGDRLGPFLIARKLGEGPAAITYTAHDDTGPVRLKVLRREATRDRRSLHRFLTLTRLSARVVHPALPAMLRTGSADGRHYVVQEAVDAQPLSARIGRTGPMHLHEARELMRSLLEGLSQLHEQRLVHGNVKLENVLVVSEATSPRILLVDAGTDRLRARPPANGHVELWPLSSPRTVSPEQLRGQLPSPASDLYAFGAVLFEVLTGKPVFDTGQIADAFVAHLSLAPRAPSTLAPSGWVPRDLDELVLALLAKEPGARPASAAAVLARLDAVGRAESIRTAAPDQVITEEELVARFDALLADPTSEDLALALESAVAEGAEGARVAEAFLLAAEQLGSGDGAADRDAAVGLYFRAARLFQGPARDPGGAEKAYAGILGLDPSNAVAEGRLDDLRRELGKHEERVEALLERVEAAAAGTDKAAVLARIGRIYAADVGDTDQALVAMTQAFCEDPLKPDYADDIERLAGSNTTAWGEVLGACNEASTGELAADAKNALFARMSRWYQERFPRPDLALSCLQAVLTTDPGNDGALEGLTSLYRKSQQWQELGMLLLRRAEMGADPGKARDLKCEAAEILELHLGDPLSARALYAEVLELDPGHSRAAEALGRLLEQTKDHTGLVRLLESQAVAQRGDERRRTLCRIAEIYEDRLADDAEAVRRYGAILDEDRGNLDALRGLDRLYGKAGRFTDLLENLGEQLGIATTPRQKIALWERVAGIHDEEFLDHEKAAYALEQVLELDPDHDAAMTDLARHYRALSRWEDLATLYERHIATVADPSRKRALAVARARIVADELHSTERGIQAYELVLTLDPEHAGSLEALARLREKAGHEDAALEAILALAERAETPETRAEHWKRAGRLLEGQGDLDGAITRYKQALDATPGDAATAASLRAAYIGRGDFNAAVQLLEREIAETDGDSRKARLCAELAEVQRSKLKDDDRAERTARRALDYDPTSIEALSLIADIAFEGQRFVEAAAAYEQLSIRADTLPHHRAVQTLMRYVDALAKSASTEKALAAMDTLLRLAPDDPTALSRVAQVTFEHGSPGRARELYDDLLVRFGSTMTEKERGAARYRAGECARRLGDLTAAVESLEAAADLDPQSALPLIALATTYEAQGDWAKVVDAKTRHLDLASGEERLKLLVDVGEIAASRLGDRPLATKSLVAALDERPDDRKLLARLMQLYSEEKDWQKLVDVVVKLAEFVDDARQKAKYLQTAAMVTGRELGDFDQALAFYDRVTKLDPSNDKAIDEAIELCEEKGDLSLAVDRLKEKARTASDAKDTPRMLEAFNKLGVLYKELGRMGHAIDAHEAAQTLEPDDKQRNQLLADLYAANPERYMGKAVNAQIAMLRQNPYRVESYKVLRRLYTDAKRADPAWCLCQALYVLKLSDPDEERFFKRMRSEDPAYAQEVVNPDDWLERLFHADSDPMLTSMFALIEPAIVATRGSTFAALGYDPAYAVDASQHPYALSQTLHYAAGVLGMELPPVFENPNDPQGLGFLPAEIPSIVLGSAALAVSASPQALAFIAGRHLTYVRPGFYIRQLVPSGTGLRAWLFAAIKMNVPSFPVAPDIEGAVLEAAQALERHLSPQLKDHLSRIVSKLVQSGAALDLRRWVQGVDLTADRVGFLLAHDLETAVEIVRASDDTSSSLAPQTRLKELVLYAISEPYFDIRQKLRIGIDV